MMLQDQLKRELHLVAKRFRWRNLWMSIALVWAAFAIGGLAIMFFDSNQVLSQPWLAISFVILLLLSTIACCVWAMMTAPDDHEIAHRLESRFPDLDSRLLTAVNQMFDDQPRGFLRERVTKQALLHNHLEPWRTIVGRRSVALAQICAVLCLFVFCALALSIWTTPPVVEPAVLSIVTDVNETTVNKKTITVVPGNGEVERGRPLVITAEFAGEIPGTSTLTTFSGSSAGEKSSHEFEMSRALNDPLFARRLATVPSDFEYFVSYPNGKSETFKITVYDLPALVQMDVQLTFPEYTTLPEKLVTDTRRVSAVIGTRVEVICRLNKSVESATLNSEDAAGDSDQLSLVADSKEPTTFRVSFNLKKSLRYKLQLQDDAGRTNRDEIELVINAIDNRQPKIVVTKPGRDVTVSAIEELPLQATVIDDFGLARFGLAFTHGESQPVEIVLGENAPANAKQFADYLLQIEELNASAGDLISYYFWAEDLAGEFNGDSVSRRVLSDMFFAEVRPFEEIYRESQQDSQPSQQQQQQQQQQNQAAEQLLQLQKQIISATWNTIRRESASTTNDAKIADDIRLIEASQRDAITQLQEAAEQFSDVEPEILEKIAATMNQAADRLKAAAEASEGRDKQLQSALGSEQLVYQQLLKLKPDEFDVQSSSQQQSSSNSQSQNSRSQQQLQQLELSNEQNRYQQQEQATANEDAQERENRQTLNRLRELARRQEDLNEQLKELQTALDAAETEEDRQEIERQLKRLREQQEDVLRDIDELKERTENSENREEMAETSQQLDEAREQVRRSAEALDRQEMSQAAAAGEKAQQQFEELRDDMHRKTAGQFTEQMEQMQDQAAELKERQDAIKQQLDAENKKNENSLRDADRPESLDEQLTQQGERLNDLLEEMQNVVREAEESEPLLSRQLYDTFREAKHEQVDEAIELSRELVDRGLMEEARQVEQQASEGIDQLKEGIERAAESVLGDETESLKRARDILDRLGEELENEIASNDPNAPQGEQAEGNESSSDRPASEEAGQSEQGESKQGEPRAGEPQNGASEQGEPKQGEGKQGEGEQSGEQSGESKGDSKGQPKSDSQGKSKSESKGTARGQGQSNSEQPNGNQPSENNESQQGEPNQQGQPGTGSEFQQLTESWQNEFGGGGRTGGSPITGENFREWSDQLRDVEEMLDDSDMRARAADIREQAREIRIEFKRHSKDPQWDIVREHVAEPLEQLKADVARELLKRQSQESLVPIDRQPVPPGFERMVRDYYERLGSGK